MSELTLAQRFEAVQARIHAACARAGRNVSSVQLIAVSKRQPLEALREAYALGQRHFGENYAQELRDKHAALSDLPGLRWHAIGPLQVKNAKYVAQAAHVFHALENVEVAQALNRRRTHDALRCLVEVNVAGEGSKAGLSPDALPAFLAQAANWPALTVVGLMAMPPLSDDAEASRPHFRAVATLAKQHGLTELSMGSTFDFEVAIEEGATWVRVGTALFGERLR
ncbi:MAG: YggS family pyridoxal phosphate-dependent enzyme [Myxococcaceae bacterium]|nr:YggS family pyridoxal phosphate-dependent enzyme [Myxococcaceae bacterium]